MDSSEEHKRYSQPNNHPFYCNGTQNNPELLAPLKTQLNQYKPFIDSHIAAGGLFSINRLWQKLTMFFEGEKNKYSRLPQLNSSKLCLTVFCLSKNKSDADINPPYMSLFCYTVIKLLCFVPLCYSLKVLSMR